MMGVCTSYAELYNKAVVKILSSKIITENYCLLTNRALVNLFGSRSGTLIQSSLFCSSLFTEEEELFQ
jgi:hypothetical protein